ncbi:MAG TPA: protein kinase [Vicinamibacterales bacterium]|nr:protein kinase [Vicinamibacterales bacterium]
MPLTSGSRLGVYDITAQIGAGGMGEVYRATDTNLKRQVAIKVLPASVAADVDRLARFQREAEVLAALNHPNIAAIYGLEKTADCTALVMELVEGDDLSHHTAKGPMPVEDALVVAKQIAAALEAAHDQGIIHRDLKPANIKVRPDGTVKVLDFGLAKAVDPAASLTPGASMSPTITTPAMTQAGMILGTAAYMAPEQARGRSVDRRADIWAFGAVLFEMLAGRRPFDGEDTTEVLGAVVRLDPQWDALPPSVPTRVMQVLRACLQKDPKRRLGDMQSVRLALEGAFESTTPASAAQSPARRQRWQRALQIVGTAVLTALAGVVVAWRLWPTVLPAPEVRLEIPTPDIPGQQNFAISPDGSSIVFSADDTGSPKLWLRRLNEAQARALEGTEFGRLPFWSPDGRSIGFLEQGTSRMKRIDLDGGVTTLSEEVAPGARGSWNRAGMILTTGGRGVARLSANGGPLETVAEASVTSITQPMFLPDGERFLCYLRDGREGIYWGSLSGSPLTFLTAADSSGQVFQDRLFYINQGTLLARTLDLRRMALTGEPERIADQVGAFSISDTGVIAVRAPIVVGRGNQLRWRDRNGASGDVVGEPGPNISVTLSLDGRRVAVDRLIQDNRDVWILDIQRGAASRFTFDPAQDGYPVWSPDGSKIAFESARQDPFDIYLKPSDSAAAEKPLLALPGVQWPYDWSSDGKYLLFLTAASLASPRDLAALPMDAADRKPIPITETSFWERNGAFSPDGRWVAYETNESGRYEVVVVSFPNRSGKWQVSTSGGMQPRWRRDGKEIYFIAPDLKMMAAAVRTSGTSLETDTPVPLFQTRVPRGGAAEEKHQYDVSRDGRFLVNEVGDAGGSPPIMLILNWRPQ